MIGSKTRSCGRRGGPSVVESCESTADPRPTVRKARERVSPVRRKQSPSCRHSTSVDRTGLTFDRASAPTVAGRSRATPSRRSSVRMPDRIWEPSPMPWLDAVAGQRISSRKNGRCRLIGRGGGAMNPPRAPLSGYSASSESSTPGLRQCAAGLLPKRPSAACAGALAGRTGEIERSHGKRRSTRARSTKRWRGKACTAKPGERQGALASTKAETHDEGRISLLSVDASL